MKQIANRKLGAILVTLTGTMFWFNVIGFMYTTTILWSVQSANILALLPWMNLPLFLVCGIVAVAVPMALWEYYIAQPSRQAYTNSQELKHQSPYAEDLRKIKDKLGIE
jgi:hypothetical protein